MILISLAILPVAILLIYIYRKDVIAKEPIGQLVKAFLGGVLTTVLSLLISMPMAYVAAKLQLPGALLPSLWEAFLEAAVPEEVFKFLMLLWLVWRSKHFDEYFDGIVYAVFISLGFACAENILYVVEGGMGTGIMRAITAVPGHFLFAVIMGYYFSLAKFRPQQRSEYLRKSLLFAIFAHGVYDFILMFGVRLTNVEGNEWIALLLIPLIIAFIVFNIKLWKRGLKKIKALRDMDIETQQMAGAVVPETVGRDDVLGD